jgi:hypothetical protein
VTAEGVRPETAEGVRAVQYDGTRWTSRERLAEQGALTCGVPVGTDWPCDEQRREL